MKKYIFLSLCFFSFFLPMSTEAVNVPITGTGIYNASGATLVFSGASFDVDAYIASHTGGDLKISGNFWLSEVADSSDETLGWATFDIGTLFVDSLGNLSSETVAPVTFYNNGTGNNFTGSGFAWSKAAGWIYFSPTNLVSGNNNSKVIYTLSTGKISGCAWSQNLGWICIDNFNAIIDTTPPILTSSTVMAATNGGILTFNEPLSKLQVTMTGSLALRDYGSTTSGIHFHTAKDYHVEATDLFGNVFNGTIQVVANVPNNSVSTYLSTKNEYRVGNGSEEHEVNIVLKDEYGNPVKDEFTSTLVQIKDVDVFLKFNNYVYLNQIDNSPADGYAIDYGSNNFNLTLLNYGTGTTSSTGSMYAKIKSYAPTKEGYLETSTGNDIDVINFNISVTRTGEYTNVGEYTNSTIPTNIDGNFKFVPTVQIIDNGLSNSESWKIIRDYETTFTGSLSKSGSVDISNLMIRHNLDLGNSNTLMSFQDLKGGNMKCAGYKTATGEVYKTNADGFCDLVFPDYKSNILKDLGNFVLLDSFKATPKVVNAGSDTFDINYTSELSYKVGGKEVKHPSYNYSASNAVVNREVKIAGITNKNTNNLVVIDTSSTQFVGNLSRAELVAQVHKNAVTYQKNGSSNGGFYQSGSYMIPPIWPNGIHTIIVDGDITISGNINKAAGSIKSIVALKKADGTGGNIWVKNNVEFIGAVLFADKAVLSGESPSSYYTDTASAKDQLFIKGSVIANNTIGGASKNPATCPYYISTCDETIAKRYDWNHFRAFVQGVIGNNSVPTTTPYGDFIPNMLTTGYDTAPLIIEYDSELQKNVPDIFKRTK